MKKLIFIGADHEKEGPFAPQRVGSANFRNGGANTQPVDDLVAFNDVAWVK
jgi:hypothetical protein